MKRYASVIGMKEEHRSEYDRLHADVWPKVLKHNVVCGGAITGCMGWIHRC